MESDAKMHPPSAMASRFVRRGAARLSYAVSAGAVAGASEVVVLHDLLEGRAGWDVLRARAGMNRYRLIMPDARGHGASAAAGRRLPLADLVADVLAVLDGEGIAAAHLIGQGLGGATALALGEWHGERVRSLVLVEPTVPALLAEDAEAEARWAAGRAREGMRQAAGSAEKGLTDRALDAFFEPRLGAAWRETLPRARLGAIRRHAAALGPLLMGLEVYAPEPMALGAIAAPTLLLRRASAVPVDRWIGERLAALLPRARLATVPDPDDEGDLLAGEAGASLVAETVAFLGWVMGEDGVGAGETVAG